jgi:hypothetical protein
VNRKAYLLCDGHGSDFGGGCFGRIVDDDGVELGRHGSSSLPWLRLDLLSKLAAHGGRESFEIVDLLREPVPERFARNE